MKTFRFLFGVLFVAVSFQGCGTKPTRTSQTSLPSEESTVQRVEGALHRAGPEFGQIQVSGQGDDIILTGSVRSPEYRARAEMIARSVHREFKLENDLQIVRR